MDSIVLNIIVIVFPIIVYFIYNCYRELRGDKYNYLVFDVMLLSSMYFCFKYGNVYSLLFCNIPIIIGYLNKRIKISLILSIACLIYTCIYFKLNIIVAVIKYIIYFIIYFISDKVRASYKKQIMVSSIVVGFFVSFEYFKVVDGSYVVNVVLLFVFMLLFYGLTYTLMNLFNLGNNITNLYISNCELEKDKKLKNSLFKITHEVKNPIAVCKGYLEMFDINNKKQSEKFISIIKSEIDRSLEIMSDFMEFSKIKIEKEIMDVNMLLEDIDNEFQVFTNNRDIDFNCKHVDDEIFIDGDYNRLKQVFINLIKNSIEAMDGVGKIDIITHILKGYYYIEISDNGRGMEEAELERVKEMFFTTKANGSGLGVSLSDEIIRSHNGKMDYYSKLGRGTKVVVKLPIVMI